jgi:hypothetical protein
MKNKCIFILGLGLFLAGQSLFATSTTFRERSENWLQSSPEYVNGPGGGRTGGEEASDDDVMVGLSPVGDALWVVFALVGAYAVTRRKRVKNY